LIIFCYLDFLLKKIVIARNHKVRYYVIARSGATWQSTMKKFSTL